MKQQLLILGPTDRARKLCARMVELGIPFLFEPPYKLPAVLPKSLDDFCLIVLSPDQAARDRKRLAAYERAGGLVWILQNADWDSLSKFERIAFASGLKLNDPWMNKRLESIPDTQVLGRCLDWVMGQTDTTWTDVLRYHIETLLQAYELLGDKELLEHVGWLVRGAIRSRPPITNCDNVACIYPILRYAQITGREKELLPACRGVADEYLANMPRYLGVLSNFINDTGVLRFEISFQVCPSLARLARVGCDGRYFDVAVDQILRCDPLLIDKPTGLWRVGRGRGGMTPTVWGRGYAQVLRGLVNTLEELPSDHPGHAKLRKILARFARGVARVQERQGHWCQLANEASRRSEPSVTAWNTAALAKGIRLGLLGDEYRPVVERGWLAVKRQVWDGLAVAVVQGTTASADPDYYRSAFYMRSSYSHFPLLAALEHLQLNRGE